MMPGLKPFLFVCFVLGMTPCPKPRVLYEADRLDWSYIPCARADHLSKFSGDADAAGPEAIKNE